MSHRLTIVALAWVFTVTGSLVASPAQAATGPIYDVEAVWGDTNLPPGGAGQFYLRIRNVGDADGSGPLTIVDELPPRVAITNIDWTDHVANPSEQTPDLLTPFCSGVGTRNLSCTLPPEKVAELAKHPGQIGSFASISPEPKGFLPPLYIDVAIQANAKGPQPNKAAITGGGASGTATDEDQVDFSSSPAGFGLVPGSYEADIFDAAFPFGTPVRQAGAHPFEQRVNFDLNEGTGVDSSEGDGLRYTEPHGRVRTVEVTLPRGMIGNPEAVPKCQPLEFAQSGATLSSTKCPADTQVGYLDVWFAVPGHIHHGEGEFIAGRGGDLTRVPIYNLKPPAGTPADFAFNAGGLVQGHIFATLDPAQNYAIKTVTPNISDQVGVRGSEVTFWGVPGDPAHDRFRLYPEGQPGQIVIGAPWGTAPARPLLTDPMDCGFDNGGARIQAESYNAPGAFTPVEEYASPLDVNGCGDPRFRFEPSVGLQPTDRHAGAPTGLDVHLEVPQRNDEVTNAEDLYFQNGDVQAIPTPPIKKAVVTLPEGMTISPSAAQGLGSCSSAQIGLGTNSPVTCPDNSQYGTLTLHTPLLPRDEPMKGFIYIAKQNENPFHEFLALYLVIEDPSRGLLVKIPGRVNLDPETGQITTTFDDLPQFPVEDIQLTFKGGVRAALVNPSTCGTKAIDAEFFSWADPLTPQRVKDSYEVTEKPDGSPCVSDLGARPFKPTLEAGTVSPTAGHYSPFVFRLTRTDDDQEFSQLGTTLAPGLIAKIAGLSECSEAAINRAEDPARTGAEELLAPSCPASSQLGTTQVGAGVGVPLTYVGGKVYLAGPYKGAPLSIVVISPAVVGPYDLGVIAVRSAARVDPRTAQVSVQTDPLPQVFKGIPVRIRDIRVSVDRPQTMLNPTNCEEMAIAAHVMGAGRDIHSVIDDNAIDLSNRFQVGSCASLGFKPSLRLRLFGGTHRGSHPRLTATLKARPGDANIASARVALPHSEFLDQAHIRTVCTRVQFAAGQCPAGSVYGFATAKTPLLDEPLSGPVYLRSSSHELPDLVATLNGKIDVEVVGRIDSIRGGIRSSFEVVPDAPVSEFTLAMQGGSKGLLVNSTDVCAAGGRATARFAAQNGRQLTLRPKLQSHCPGRRTQRRHHSHN